MQGSATNKFLKVFPKTYDQLKNPGRSRINELASLLPEVVKERKRIEDGRYKEVKGAVSKLDSYLTKLDRLDTRVQDLDQKLGCFVNALNHAVGSKDLKDRAPEFLKHAADLLKAVESARTKQQEQSPGDQQRLE